MKSFGKRMFPMFAMAAIAIVIASGVSFAQFEDESGATLPSAADGCAPVHEAPASDCATEWQILWGAQN
jgi:hypothetical protein